MKASTVVALGLSTLAIAAPTPAVSEPGQRVRHVTFYGFIFKIPRLPGSRVTVHGSKMTHDTGVVNTAPTTEEEPSPSVATATATATSLLVTSSLPLPVHTTVLLAQGLATGVPRIEESEEEVEEPQVPDTVSPTSYARIEAGLIELYPPQPEEVPCAGHTEGAWRMSKYRYDAAVVGLVFSFLLVLLAVESWTAVCPCIRQAFLCEGSIRLEGDAKACSKPSFRADDTPCGKGTQTSPA